jgi:hypothetical protein
MFNSKKQAGQPDIVARVSGFMTDGTRIFTETVFPVSAGEIAAIRSGGTARALVGGGCAVPNRPVGEVAGWSPRSGIRIAPGLAPEPVLAWAESLLRDVDAGKPTRWVVRRGACDAHWLDASLITRVFEIEVAWFHGRPKD